MEKEKMIGERYEVKHQLGKGGNSSVFLCHDKKLHKDWAVKEIYEPTDIERSMELELLKTVSCNVFPRIVDVVQEGSSIFLVMDYVKGITLKEKMKQQILTEADVLPWAFEVAKGIRYLHQMNPPILYMDCKPDNIMLTDEGEIRLIDLGSVYVCQCQQSDGRQEGVGKKQRINEFVPEMQRNSQTGLLVPKKQRISGTRFFAPKEQCARKQGDSLPDVRTDIYAFGMTLYYLLTGGKKEYRKNGKLCIRMVNPAISWGMSHIIEKCTMENPKHRYQSMEEVIYQLRHIKEVGRRRMGEEKIYQLAAVSGKIVCAIGALFFASMYQMDNKIVWGIIALGIGGILMYASIGKRATIYEINREIFCGAGKKILGFVMLLTVLVGGMSISSYAARKVENIQDVRRVNLPTAEKKYENEEANPAAIESNAIGESTLKITLYDEKGRKILIRDGASWGVEQDIYLSIPMEEIGESDGKVTIIYADGENGTEKWYSFACYRK